MLSNYKLEVENTEKLNSDINSAFTEINAELEKDDNFVASDLFDVDKKIEELKKSRKKWASGTELLADNNDYIFKNDRYNYYLTIPNKNFNTISTIIFEGRCKSKVGTPNPSIRFNKSEMTISFNEGIYRKINGEWKSLSSAPVNASILGFLTLFEEGLLEGKLYYIPWYRSELSEITFHIYEIFE